MKKSRSGSLNLLVAWPYFDDKLGALLSDIAPDVRLIVDSGAFTAWKKGETLRVEDYCAFLNGLPKGVEVDFYFNLDVIADAEGSDANMHAMQERGFRPVPVFTRGMTLERFDRMREESDIVAIGGIVKGARTKVGPYLKALTERAAGHRLHLLGLTENHFIRYFLPFSCDSSSWSRAERYGLLDVYMGHGRFKRLYRYKLDKRPDEETIDRLNYYGCSVHDLLQEKAWRGGKSLALLIATRCWLDAINDYAKAIGVRIYLATSNTHHTKFLHERFKEWETGIWERATV